MRGMPDLKESNGEFKPQKARLLETLEKNWLLCSPYDWTACLGMIGASQEEAHRAGNHA